MNDLALFDMQPATLPEPAEKLSADRRRTLRQKQDAENGIHPLTRRRIHSDETRTCGNCRFRQSIRYHDRSYPKCTFGDSWPRATHSAASDVRAWWPGCPDHEWGDSRVSDDAARWVPES